MREHPDQALWLRSGYPIAPAFLRQTWPDLEIPPEVLRAAGLPELRLAALDASVWTLLGNQEKRAIPLARYISSLLTIEVCQKRHSEVHDSRIAGFGLPANLRLDELAFRRRTRNILTKTGWLRNTDWASTVTVSEFLSLRQAGVVSLVDFAVVLEQAHSEAATTAGSSAKELERLLERTRAIRARISVDEYSAADPRLPLTDLPGRTLGEVLDSLDSTAMSGSLKQLRSLQTRAQALDAALVNIASAPLAQSFLDLLKVAVSRRHVPLLARRLGWDGLGGATLEEAAQPAHISRERMRQIEAQCLKKISAHLYCPALDRAISRLDAAVQRLELDGVEALRPETGTSSDFLPFGVARAAEVLGRRHKFGVGRDGRTLLGFEEADGEALRAAAMNLNDTGYIASVLELQARASDIADHEISLDSARTFLAAIKTVRWLDSEKEWFWLEKSAYGSAIAYAVRKVLSVVGRLQLESLRSGALRPLKVRGANVPRGPFAGFCRALGCTVEGSIVHAPPALRSTDAWLSATDKIIVDVFAANENVLMRSELVEACVRRGMTRGYFNVVSAYSPLLERVARGVYALRGAPVDPARVAHLVSEGPPRQATLQEHGWTDDGTVWFGCRVTASVVNSGTLNIPRNLSELLAGRQYELLTPDGSRAGTLGVGNLIVWGLAPFVRRRGVEPGDCLVLLFDTAGARAVVQSGTLELLALYRDGDGESLQQLLESRAKHRFEDGIEPSTGALC